MKKNILARINFVRGLNPNNYINVRRKNMNIVFVVIGIATAQLITACANFNDPQAIAKAIKTEHDDFLKLTEYTGPHWSGYFMRAHKLDGESQINYQIYIGTNYSGSQWHFYDSAFDSDGNSLDTTLISRKVNSCSVNSGCYYSEDLALNLTRTFLEAHQKDGLKVKLFGKGGEEVVSITPEYIGAFLSIVK